MGMWTNGSGLSPTRDALLTAPGELMVWAVRSIWLAGGRLGPVESSDQGTSVSRLWRWSGPRGHRCVD